MDREILIGLANKYNGEYFAIKKAIENNEIADVSKIEAITILDEIYPKELFDLKCPPLVLFYKGNIQLLRETKIAIVGSRKPSEYALRATGLLANNRDEVIVSGLARGIDACAHQNAKRTIAVLGCGIDYIYPYENRQLYQKIEREGLIISEYPSMCKPLAYHFPFRNRIIAALCKEVYIMEAYEKSGTITTVNEALEIGRDIKVLPVSIFDKNQYNNQLINDGALIISQKDLIDKRQ